MRVPILALCFNLLFGLIAGQASALDITPGRGGLCLLTLSGTIEQGDVEKLRAASLDMPVTWTDFEDGRWKTICLDSPGGSLSAGLEIARFVSENSIGTVVDDGQTCLSACALIFMFGTAYQHESASITHRKMHVGGRIGFHQPDLTLRRDRDYSVDDVEAAFDLAIQATLNFLALAARPRPDTPRPFVDADLLEAMLQHQGQNFFEIDTVNKAGRWDIALFGFTPPQVSKEALFHACRNALAWNVQLVSDHQTYDPNGFFPAIEVRSGDPDFIDGRRYSIDFSEMLSNYCEAGVISDWRGETGVGLCGFHEATSSQIGPDSCLSTQSNPMTWPVLPSHALYPANKTLASVKAQAGRATQPRIVNQPNLCQSTTGRARVINVNSFTSLRNNIGHDSPRIDTLPLGSSYAIGTAPTADWQHPQHQRCLALCRAAELGQPYSQAALNACIDTNWLWFEIVGPSGRTGYASAKFLDY